MKKLKQRFWIGSVLVILICLISSWLVTALPIHKADAAPLARDTSHWPSDTHGTLLAGAAIIVAGRFRTSDALQTNITNMANQAYSTLLSNGYTADSIFYLNPDPTEPGVDAVSSLSNLQAAITTWSLSHVAADRPLTLYLTDHGNPDVFYLDQTVSQTLTSAALDGWLDQVEAARPGLKINVIIESAYAGTFINELSEAGRMIVASADAISYASTQGGVFSDAFWLRLNQGKTFFQAFTETKTLVQTSFPSQTPVLDDNGDGVANAQDGGVAQQRNLVAVELVSPPKTLIVVNYPRMTQLYGASAVQLLTTQINALAAHSAVQGLVIQADGIAGIDALYTQWDNNPADMSAAQAVAVKIRERVKAERSNYPSSIAYTVLVGDDRIVPHWRILDQSIFHEDQYTQVPLTTTVGKALQANQLLVDDFYGDVTSPVTATVFLPNIATSRLVETPVEIGSTISRFMATPTFALQTALAVGWDFVEDASTAACTRLGARLVTTDCTLIGNTWPQLLKQKLAQPYDFVLLGTHADHYNLSGPGGEQISAAEVAALSSTFDIVFSFGGHDGLSVGSEMTPTTQVFDLVQAWLSRSAIYISASAFTIGNRLSIGLSEKLATNFVDALTDQNGTVGQAFVQMKSRYYAETIAAGTLTGTDQKVLSTLLLYGLPMQQVQLSNQLPTPTPTPTSTPPVMPTATVLPIGSGDVYEADDACAAARDIATDGTVQQHTLHKQADADWMQFNAISGTSYIIEAQVPPGSPADLELELHAICGQPTAAQNFAYAPGVRYKFIAGQSGLVRMKIQNGDGSVFGSQVAYQVSVATVSNAPPQGAVIIVAGRLDGNDALQGNIHNVTDAVSRTFRMRGYAPERIRYLATDLDRSGVSAAPSLANLQDAITNWALDKVGPNQPLTLYLMDHGNVDVFYLDNTRNEILTPALLDGWLTQLEAARPGLKINIIIEACFSGSFIQQPGSISKSGRVVLTSASADNVAWASPNGAEFSDRFLQGMSQGESMFDAFVRARWAVESAFLLQVPFLDDNGDGLANTPQDGAEAQRRGFTYPGTFAGLIVTWPPYIKQVLALNTAQTSTHIIRATVLDDGQVRSVYARIYPPDYRPPNSQAQLISENIPTVPLTDRGRGEYELTYPLFTKTGQYRIVVYAEDSTGEVARPVTVFVQSGNPSYMPALVK